MTDRVERSRDRAQPSFWSSRFSAIGTPAESLRIERVIAVSRLFLTVISFVAIDLDPVDHAYQPIAIVLLSLFAAHSIAAILVLRRRQRTTRAFALTTHTIDLVAAAITLPMAGPTNSFFSFFLFVLAAAAFRWGLRETLATAVAAIVLVLFYAELVTTLPLLSIGARQALDLTVVRAGYLAMMGILLGYLAEETRLLRAEAAAVVALLAKIRVDAGLTRALAAVANFVVPLFQASHLLLVIEDLATHRIFRWDTTVGWGVGPTTAAPGDPPGMDGSRYLFGPPDQSVAIERRWWRWRVKFPYRVTALDTGGRVVEHTKWKLPDSFLEAHRFRRLISAPVTLGDEWSGRIFVFDPKRKVRAVALARFLQMLVQQASPAVFNVHLLDRLRARAGAIERARVARELHDGVIQSLIGVEMQLEVLRGQDPLRDTPAARELTNLQAVVRNEVLNLRELMQQMRPLEFDPEEFLEHLADMVQRFGRNTGITAHFSSHLTDVKPAPQICFELARIVQESLVNVRKHSAASNVLVRFGAKDGCWGLEVEDDGCGFPFEGKFSQADLDTRRIGPIVIKERVRAIGGQLSIDSMSGRGARLEVLVPQKVRRRSG